MVSVIVASRRDEVSMKIAEILRECYDFKEVNESLYRARGIELRMIEEKHVYADGLGESWNADLLIVASIPSIGGRSQSPTNSSGWKLGT